MKAEVAFRRSTSCGCLRCPGRSTIIFENSLARCVGNVNLPIVEAMQTIKFRLDRSGAAVESEVASRRGGDPSNFLNSTGRSLSICRKRGAEQPFFVMWVDNAELLVLQMTAGAGILALGGFRLPYYNAAGGSVRLTDFSVRNGFGPSKGGGGYVGLA